MTDVYRDEREALLEKNRALEQKLAQQERELETLKRRSADQDAVFLRLESALVGIDERGAALAPQKRSRVGLTAAVVALLGVMVGVGVALTVFRARAQPSGAPPEPPKAEAVPLPKRAPSALPSVPTGDLCATPGVKLTVDGTDAFAPATTDRDLAGHGYHRGGTRSPWFTVNMTGRTGPLYVHGVGDFLTSDLGRTSLTLFSIVPKGDSSGYTLARGGRSMIEVTRSDGKLIAGRFEADMSHVADTTREPPFGTSVVRVRGEFCLPAYPANPHDTGP